MDRWHDPEFARAWDRRAEFGNPAREEHLSVITAIVRRIYQPGCAILDLGAGSGQVEQRIIRTCPQARVVAVDASPAMLDLARDRLRGANGRVELVHGDISTPSRLVVPEHDYQIALAVQALHHITDAAKRELLAWLHARLMPNGIVIIADRVQLEPALGTVYKAAWEWEEDRASAKSGWDGQAFLRRFEAKGDHTATLEDHYAALRAAGFVATCLYLRLHRVLFVASKR